MQMILKITKEYEKIDIIRKYLYALDEKGVDVTFNNETTNKYFLLVNDEVGSFTTYKDVISALRLLLAVKEENNDKGQ